MKKRQYKKQFNIILDYFIARNNVINDNFSKKSLAKLTKAAKRYRATNKTARKEISKNNDFFWPVLLIDGLPSAILCA